MAESVVSYVIEKTDDWLTKELNLDENIKTGIKNLKRLLEMMRAFLEDMDARRKQDDNQNSQIQVWTQQLRSVAYEIEVVLDKFEYQNAQQNASRYASIKSRMENYSIANLIQEIETSLSNIREMKSTYPTDFSSHTASTSSDHEHEAGIAPLYTPEVEIVGIEEPRKELVTWVLDVEQEYKVMFVVGMGGSGKTTLVKLVYEQLKEDFNCHVWLTASMYGQRKILLSTMFNELSNNQTGHESSLISSNSIRNLTDSLKNYLKDKRYLIVLDDLREKDIWESVSRALPRVNNSRVIITTRRGDTASSCRENSVVDVYNVQPLPHEKAQRLFYTRAFPEISGTYPSAPCGMYPSSEKLLNECDGLPLGIIEIGKLLSNRERSESELKKLHDGLQAEIASGQLSSIARVLLLSYDELPYDQKHCFLYMSMFPASYSVKRRMLIRLWIAEGFIKSEKGKILEDIGEKCLKKLMERNLIQAGEVDFDGRPRTCRVHNLMHKIILSKSEAESFCTIGGDISGKTRRLSIQNSEFNMPEEILRHAHTLFTSSINLSIPPSIIISKMKLLKTLHLDHANVDALPSGIEKLYLLKYLSLGNTGIKLIPEAIGRLQLLETLNLKKTYVTTMPKDLEKLGKLRHLLVCRYNINSYLDFDAVQGFNAPKGISKLTNLQKLSFVRADKKHKLIRELQKLTQLRKLGITDLPSNSGTFLCTTVQMLRNLHSLNLTALQRNEFLEIQEISKPPPLLQRLYLKGRLEKMPHWISEFHDLQRIRLKWSRLTDGQNPITVLGELHNLLELQLLDAYTGSQLDFDAGTFPKLKILEFERMENLKFIMIDHGALPCLQKLIIRKCRNLRQIPVGIDSMTQLKELDLSDMPSDFVDPLRRNGEMCHLVQHIETICLRHLQHNNQWKTEYV